jgi:hypothetical protein
MSWELLCCPVVLVEHGVLDDAWIEAAGFFLQVGVCVSPDALDLCPDLPTTKPLFPKQQDGPPSSEMVVGKRYTKQEQRAGKQNGAPMNRRISVAPTLP